MVVMVVVMMMMMMMLAMPMPPNGNKRATTRARGGPDNERQGLQGPRREADNQLRKENADHDNLI
eukprot:8878213-Pyramimonas_sp.AAC.1